MFMWYLNTDYQILCAGTTIFALALYGFCALCAKLYDKIITKKHFRDSY
jgi:hypothetical protein